ncbi:MAG: hypothetical protein ACO3CH_09125, partial [Ilumatobacteraceae bacterium]
MKLLNSRIGATVEPARPIARDAFGTARFRYSVVKVRKLTIKGKHRFHKEQTVHSDTKPQIRLISNPYGKTLDRSGAGVVGIGIDLIRIRINRI